MEGLRRVVVVMAVRQGREEKREYAQESQGTSTDLGDNLLHHKGQWWDGDMTQQGLVTAHHLEEHGDQAQLVLEGCEGRGR